MARRHVALRAFAQCLPNEFRERVFEPALEDLTYDERSRSGGARALWTARLVLVAECLRLGLPQLVWRRGRPTRFAAAALAMIMFISLLVLRRNYTAWPPER